MTNHLFSPFSIKGLELKNRVVMAPMCQYAVQALDGVPNDWHYVHYVSRAVGGVGLMIMEMTDVEPDGRISNYDLGLWSDEQIPAFARIIEGVKAYGTKIGIQIGHAGRKAEDAAKPVAPSAIPFPESKYKEPHELTTEEVQDMVRNFAKAVNRAVVAGVDVIELHGAHGYLIHQFQSPLTNRRLDEYGQSLEKFGVEVIKAVRQEMPADMPLIFRISAVEYTDGGYDLDYSLKLCSAYKEAGVDLFHVSSGGEGPAGQRKPGNYPGYQVPFARAIREALSIPVIAVGMLDEPALAESVVTNGDADLVAIGRGLLRDPYWPIHAAKRLGAEIPSPRQYSYFI